MAASVAQRGTVANWAATTLTKTVTGLAWSAGDTIVIWGTTSDGSVSIGTPTNANLTFTLRASSTGGVGAECQTYFWTAEAGSAQTGQTISATRGATVGEWGMEVFVITGSGGYVASSAVVNRAEGVIGRTTAAGSVVIYGLGDWNASAAPGSVINTDSTTGTPTLRMNQQHSSIYTIWSYQAVNTAAGTFNFGMLTASYSGLRVTHGLLEVAASASVAHDASPAPEAFGIVDSQVLDHIEAHVIVVTDVFGVVDSQDIVGPGATNWVVTVPDTFGIVDTTEVIKTLAPLAGVLYIDYGPNPGSYSSDAAVNVGVVFEVDAAVDCLGLRFFKDSSEAATGRTFYLKNNDTFADLGSATSTGEQVTHDDYVDVYFDTPITLVAGQQYLIQLHKPNPDGYRLVAGVGNADNPRTLGGVTLTILGTANITTGAGNGRFVYTTDPQVFAGGSTGDNGYAVTPLIDVSIPWTITVTDTFGVTDSQTLDHVEAHFIVVNDVFGVVDTADVVGSGASQFLFLWTEAVPAPNYESGDTNEYTLGTIFTVDANTDVDGICFYKFAGMTGTHRVGLFINGNTTPEVELVATGEPASGWHFQPFVTPFACVPGTQYIAAFTTPSTGYPAEANAFNGTAVVNAPFTGIITADDSQAIGNGRFVAAAATALTYPNSQFGHTSYGVSPYIVTAGPTAHQITVTDLFGLVDTTVLDHVEAHQIVVTDVFGLVDSQDIVGPGATNHVVTVTDVFGIVDSADTVQAHLVVVTDLFGLVDSTDIVTPGPTAHNITVPDLFGLVDSQNIVGPAASKIFLWDEGTPAPNYESGDTNEYTLGTIFTVDANTDVIGVCFYKFAGMTGTHLVGLFDNVAGTLLASATVTGETASGWQFQPFAAPFACVPGTQYIAAFTTPSTGYPAEANAFNGTAVVNAPFTGIITADDSQAIGNGRFVAAAATALTYPNSQFGHTSYGVSPYINGLGPTAHTITVVDLFGLTDTADVVGSGPVAHQIVVSDLFGIVEVDQVFAYTLSLTDAFGLVDSQTILGPEANVITVTDLFGLVDSQVLDHIEAHQITVTDVFGLVDSQTVDHTEAHFIVVSDVFGLVDSRSIISSGVTAHEITVVDPFGLVDTADVVLDVSAHIFTVTDPFGITDAVGIVWSGAAVFVPSTVAAPCDIGCAPTLARVIDRRTGAIVCDNLLDKTGAEWSWTRTRNRPSEANIAWNSRCKDCLDGVEPWTHELEIERFDPASSGYKRAWIGPVMAVDFDEETDSVALTAFDRMIWMAKRKWIDLNFTGDASILFTEAIRIAQLNDDLRLHPRTALTGRSLSLDFVEGDDIAETIDGINGLVWWSMQADRLYSGPVDVRVVGDTLTEAWFNEDGYQRSRNGGQQANVIKVRWANGTVTWPVNGFDPAINNPPGELVEVFDYTDIETRAEAYEIAEALYNERRFANMVLTNSDIELAKCAPIEIATMTPGTWHQTSIEDRWYGELVLDTIEVNGIQEMETGVFVLLRAITEDERRVVTVST